MEQPKNSQYHQACAVLFANARTDVGETEALVDDALSFVSFSYSLTCFIKPPVQY